MSVSKLIGLSMVEMIGDAALKEYANGKGIFYLGVGIIGYIGVVFLLILSLKGSTLLMVNNGWDAISSIMESLFAVIVLGERFQHIYQYFGSIMIVIGLYLLKLPKK